LTIQYYKIHDPLKIADPIREMEDEEGEEDPNRVGDRWGGTQGTYQRQNQVGANAEDPRYEQERPQDRQHCA
jgi:hypothetical protein